MPSLIVCPNDCRVLRYWFDVIMAHTQNIQHLVCIIHSCVRGSDTISGHFIGFDIKTLFEMPCDNERAKWMRE